MGEEEKEVVELDYGYLAEVEVIKEAHLVPSQLFTSHLVYAIIVFLTTSVCCQCTAKIRVRD